MNDSRTFSRSLSARGGTLIDVLLAMIILTTFGAWLMQSVTTAARLGGRCNRIAAASLLASNESERIKAAGAYGWHVNDSSYTAQIKGTEYRISRSTLPQDMLKNKYATGVNQEIEIAVGINGAKEPIVRFRILQGHQQ
jgi:hypothetical protein